MLVSVIQYIAIINVHVHKLNMNITASEYELASSILQSIINK